MTRPTPAAPANCPFNLLSAVYIYIYIYIYTEIYKNMYISKNILPILLYSFGLIDVHINTYLNAN